MTLSELRTQYEQGNISLLKLTRMALNFKDELDVLYPYDIRFNGKLHLYLNDLDWSVGFCEKSQKERAFNSVSKGFRQFCGNQGSCECNSIGNAKRWSEITNDEQQATNEKRKKTVQKKYGVDHVSELMEMKEKAAKTCIARYGTKSPTQNPDVLRKSSNTCMKNNGVAWPQQNQDIFDKTTQIFKDRYGISRPAQFPAFQDRAKQTCIARYGVEIPMQIPEVSKKVTMAVKKKNFNELLSNRSGLTPLFTIDEYANCHSDDLLLWKCNTCTNEFYQTFKLSNNKSCSVCNPKHQTWGETLIESWLKEAGVEYEMGSFSIIKPQQLDFYLADHKLAIEFNGLYWHSELAGRTKSYHVNKFKKCDELNIKLIQVFEHELLRNEALIKERILNALGKNTHRLYARKLKVAQISSREARDFLNDHHTQGGLPSAFNYALVKDGVIYSVMSFSKVRYSKTLADWELTRFASRSSYSVVGAASRLFSAFVNENQIDSVVSYADLKWGKGNVYKKMGFEFSHYSQPNYWYFRGIDSVTSRIKFQKHKLPKDLHHLGSEWEIMKHLKWNRYWDCGNAVWVWRKE